MASSAFDYPKLRQALYCVDLPDERWLRTVLRELAPLIEHDHMGCFALTFQAREAARFSPLHVVSIRMGAGLRGALQTGLRALPYEYVVERYFNRAWSFGSTIPGWSQIPAVRDSTLSRLGAEDMFVVTSGVTPTGIGCSFGCFAKRSQALYQEMDAFLPYLAADLRGAFSCRSPMLSATRPPSASRGASANGRGSADKALSPRQQQTLGLLLAGLTDKEIAERLHISRYTVNEYTKVIYAHFNVHSRSRLVAHCALLDLGGPHDPPRAGLASPRSPT